MKNVLLGLLSLLLTVSACASAEDIRTEKLLYVAEPGIRDDLKYGGHGLLVFDMDHDFKFVKRIETHGLDDKGKPLNVKGICASKELHCVYVSTTKTLECIDLITEKSLWEKPYEGGCDRMSISQDSKFIYLPSLEGDHWHVVDPKTGDVLRKIVPKSGSHNTLISLDGTKAFLAGLKSKAMTVADTKTMTAASTISFSDNVRPFTMNAKGTTIYACLNNLLGFEIGDVASGKMTRRIEVPGFSQGKVLRHGCPSHGIGLTPDESEIWVCDAHNKRVHIFENTGPNAPTYSQSVELRDEPGWVTFSIDGKYAIPSTGDVLQITSRKMHMHTPDDETRTHFWYYATMVENKIVNHLTDETGAGVQSEKLLEIDVVHAADGSKTFITGDQFGFGRIQK